MDTSSLQMKERALILKSLQETITFIGTLQEGFHRKVIIPATLYTFKYKSTDLVDTILNELLTVKGTIRYESVAYWFKHMAGFNTEYSEKLKGYITTLACKSGQPAVYVSEVVDYKTGLPVKFKYDAKHLDVCKDSKYRFWSIAPVQHKDLKVAEDALKVVSSSEIQLARALALGSLTEEGIASAISGMLDRIRQSQNSKKIKEYVVAYRLQHDTPTVLPEVEVLSEVEQELIAAELDQVELEAA